ncbi:SGNH/GDSL hydrolase family protein [Alienimonas chondri]|uniref:SGNH hydrolase-type esterase domain-containing protein n=1 Tax=Alienimonas chondri TaxID=2681879 RepID=A0ABX1VGG3_9PLAN|nr:SGNH/GDSL hydrolase family protein [Alienimonas chondri]NNJ26357.1 hypothetical protein [Alienimonas chondri]
MSRKHAVPAVLIWLTAAAFAAAEPPIRPGDRIAVIGNTFADQLRIHGYLETALLNKTRENPVSIRNLGWAGDMLTARDRPTGFPTEEATLTEHETDVLIACFGMGESFDGERGLDDFKSQLRELIASHAGKTYNGVSEVRLILVSPIACEDLGELTPNRDERNRDLEAYTRAMRDVADDAGTPFVDLFEASRYLMDESVGPKLTSNGIHLNPYGHWAVSHAFFDQLTADDPSPDQRPWLLRIDAAKRSAAGRGVSVSDLAADDSGLSFQVAEDAPPSLPPPTERPLPPQLEFARDALAVENLEPGTYELTIDGTPVATASAEDWADGVPVDASPAHQAAEAFRNVVNDKNLQFTYSWKALNQVHIVGERRSSPSGRALPGEVIEFNQLANALDETLSEGMELKTRRWRLTRVPE